VLVLLVAHSIVSSGESDFATRKRAGKGSGGISIYHVLGVGIYPAFVVVAVVELKTPAASVTRPPGWR